MKKHLAASVMAAVVLLACGGADDSGGVLEGDNVAVDMFDNRFEFTEIRIPVGGSVNWIGAGRNPHNAVEADSQWTTESVFGSLEQLEGDEAILVYNEPGEYPFFCTFHGNGEGSGMAGTLIVEASSG